jgi:hypothetical protein
VGNFTSPNARSMAREAKSWFLVYLPICAWTIRRLRWGFVGFVAMLAGLPPFGTFLFEVWAARTGRMAELSAPKIEAQRSPA